MKIISAVILYFSLILYGSCNDSVIYINSGNHDQVIGSSDIVFTAFCADWCPFSRRLKPIWEDAGKKWQEKHPGSSVTFAIVDSVQESEVADKYFVNKFPTMKIFINGEVANKEYRGARNVDALHKFVNEHLAPAFREFSSPEQLHRNIDKSKRNIVSYFPNTNDVEFKNLKKVSAILKDDCEFWLGKDDAVKSVTGNSIVFHDPDTNDEQRYTGSLNDYEFLKTWITDKCIPLVREVTFENVEELTEEGLPFLLYFRDPKDTEGDKKFANLVQNELREHKGTVNALLADGFKFAHPLKHLGKTSRDLPVVAIDSFQHMFLFPDMSKLYEPGQLKKFILDLHSGKLHKDFHDTLDQRLADLQKFAEEQAKIEPKDGSAGPPSAVPIPESTPKTSVFKELKPSEKRYSLLTKNEL
uniref:Thioredoxin domain-containing protein n=1 Tax=Parastrongyloides trichosuri TaxID=131310 RepID=A0A0N4Z011_PARTI